MDNATELGDKNHRFGALNDLSDKIWCRNLIQGRLSLEALEPNLTTFQQDYYRNLLEPSIHESSSKSQHSLWRNQRLYKIRFPGLRRSLVGRREIWSNSEGISGISWRELRYLATKSMISPSTAIPLRERVILLIRCFSLGVRYLLERVKSSGTFIPVSSVTLGEFLCTSGPSVEVVDAWGERRPPEARCFVWKSGRLHQGT